MTDEFVALDVETANPDLASICQIGVVSFVDGTVSESWKSLINPEDYFCPVNVSIHGIDEDAVRDAPSFPDIVSHLRPLVSGRIVVSHTAFDRVAMTQVHEKYSLPPVECTWLDTARVCRRAWKQFSRRGYGLADVASWCGIDFKHHDAEEDARAAGLVLLRAISDTGMAVDDWVIRSAQPTDSSGSTRIGNPEGTLAGEVVVFTGALSMLRQEAADLAASVGCDVAAGVTKTTLLVVGDQDIRKLAGHEKSSKHRKAEELIRKGHPLRVLGETDFNVLVRIE